GIYAQFLAGFAAAAVVARLTAIEPNARALLAALAGAGAGALTGLVILGLKWRFAVHEVLSGILLGGLLAPRGARRAPGPRLLARADRGSGTPGRAALGLRLRTHEPHDARGRRGGAGVRHPRRGLLRATA